MADHQDNQSPVDNCNLEWEHRIEGDIEERRHQKALVDKRLDRHHPLDLDREVDGHRYLAVVGIQLRMEDVDGKDFAPNSVSLLEEIHRV